MDYDYFTFRSITRGQLALRELQEADVNAALLRTPKALTTEGCGYTVRVRAGEGDRAAGILARSDVPYQRRFRQSGGQYREVAR